VPLVLETDDAPLERIISPEEIPRSVPAEEVVCGLVCTSPKRRKHLLKALALLEGRRGGKKSKWRS
jgi:hypothetical protein